MTSFLRENRKALLWTCLFVVIFLVGFVVWTHDAKAAPMRTDQSPAPQNLILIESDRFNVTSLDKKTFAPVTREYKDTDYEFIKPLKSSPQPLHENDIIFDERRRNQKKANTPPIRHHSGHFRHVDASIWDPHPEYDIVAFGKQLHLILSQSPDFIAPDLHFSHHWHNHSIKYKSPKREYDGCFYTGHVANDDQSKVSVSLCHGMLGYIQTANETLFIEPVEVYPSNAAPFLHPILHSVRRITNNQSLAHFNDVIDDKNCGNDEEQKKNKSELAENEDDPQTKPTAHSIQKRGAVYSRQSQRQPTQYQSRRADPSKTHSNKKNFYLSDDIVPNPSLYQPQTNLYDDEYSLKWSTLTRDENVVQYMYDNREKRNFNDGHDYFVEVLVAADRSMLKLHNNDESELHHYILTLMAHVALLYKDATIGHPMTISVVSIITLREDDFQKTETNQTLTASELLKKFCRWKRSLSIKFDAALFLTRIDMCREPDKLCDTLGLANIGTMCSKESNCAVIKDNGLATSFTLAHEIGHLLGMQHDDAAICHQFHNGRKITGTMSMKITSSDNPWLWSPCARYFLTEFLESSRSVCLQDRPTTDLIDAKVASKRMPGENIDEDRQCELMYGPNYIECSYQRSTCGQLYCAQNMKVYELCIYNSNPVADGTSCGNGSWCHHGKCVQSNVSDPVSGGWGPYGPWSECSLSCGGGIQNSMRECDNPKPLNFGKYCVGRAMRYRSCNVQQCQENQDGVLVDVRESQCSKYNGNNRGIFGVPSDVVWIPKYGVASDKCKLFCRVENSNSTAYYPLAEKVIDGTKCDLDSYDICVNGICRSGGCDNKLNSNTTLDLCGICGGNNSQCQKVTGFKNHSTYGYSEVVRIPKGSLNILVTQRGEKKYDGNYLALFDQETGMYKINGNFSIMNARRRIAYGGVTFEYSGSNTTLEMINSTWKQAVNRDIVIQVLTVENNPPDIEWSYTVLTETLQHYAWRYDSQSTHCDSICNGYRYKKPLCVHIKRGQIMPEGHCTNLEPPILQREPCNLHCNLTWEVVSHTECSVHCGQGERRVHYQCVQLMLESNRYGLTPRSVIDDGHCKNVAKPPEVEPCFGLCDSTSWQYSDWTPCSTSCDSGIKSRNARCVDKFNVEVDPKHCDIDKKLVAQGCFLAKCPSWRTNEWTACSNPCGFGTQTRKVQCFQDNQLVSDHVCTTPQPSTQQTCTGTNCHSWTTSQWSSCSVTCGQGEIHRKVYCQNINTGVEVSADECNDNERPEEYGNCVMSSCEKFELEKHRRSDDDYTDNTIPVDRGDYVWGSGIWSNCTKPCGGGIKRKIVYCMDPRGKKIPNDYCNAHTKPNEQVPCNVEACPPKWQTGDWSKCDSHCFKNRQVRCMSTRGETLDDAACYLEKRPHFSERCPSETCVLFSQPQYGKSSGGYGQGKEYGRDSWWERSTERSRERFTERSRSTSTYVPYSISFMPITQPSSTHSAILAPSIPSHSRIYRWNVTTWSPCSRPCGKGVRIRKKFCLDDTNQKVSDKFCQSLRAHNFLLKKSCSRKLCSGWAWKAGEWGDCSRDCGDGVQTRDVRCHSVNKYGFVLPSWTAQDDINCAINDKPETRRGCFNRFCHDQYYLVEGPWSQCSQRCGRKGIQKRQIFCRNRMGDSVQKGYCRHLRRKRQKKRKCNIRRCGFYSCKDIREQTNVTSDGQYVLMVHGKNVSVYCYKMNTANPVEYLTLTGNNFAEFYHKSLNNLSSCPNNGQRSPHCLDCSPSPHAGPGYTEYHRIQINVETLQVKIDDGTFARRIRGQLVPYGTAGDCYSQAPNCAQGRFEINLHGTGFKVSRHSQWVKKGENVTINISINDPQKPTKIKATCGGYCGKCEPSSLFGLMLEVI